MRPTDGLSVGGQAGARVSKASAMDEHPTGAPGGGRPADDGDGQPKLADVESTLEHLARLCSRLEQAEQRFKQMTDECGTVLDGLVSVDRRHATTLATLNDRLGDWCNIERKLLEESARRIDRFERGVEHEWTALRRLHEEPLSELRDQADRLRIACLEAAGFARERLDAAEQSYASHAADLERRLAEWTREVLKAASRPALTDGSNGGGETGLASTPPAVEPWPLDGVAQLHQELRTGAAAAPPKPHYLAGRETEHGETASPAAPAMESEEEKAARPVAPAPLIKRVYLALAATAALVVVAILVGTGAYVVRMQGRLVDLEAKAREAVRQVKSADRAPQARAASASDVVQADNRAVALVAILAAPDLRRYDLVGVGDGQGAYGQVLWSRSHGMVVTAMRLPAATGRTYRVWIEGDGRLAGVGALQHESASTARLVVPGPLTLPRPASITVTLENNAAVDRPSGPALLTRVPAS
jgi:hypothetical protein